MDKWIVTAASRVTDADVRAAKLGVRFGRLDLSSQLALLAVESLGISFSARQRDRIGICLACRTGSLATDVEYWNGRDNTGGPSPTLFAYTLPSAAIGEIAIRHQLTGPNLCLVGDSTGLLREAIEMIRMGEADSCLCVDCHVVTPTLASLIPGSAPTTRACALFLELDGTGQLVPEENDRDIESWCALFSTSLSDPAKSDA